MNDYVPRSRKAWKGTSSAAPFGTCMAAGGAGFRRRGERTGLPSSSEMPHEINAAGGFALRWLGRADGLGMSASTGEISQASNPNCSLPFGRLKVGHIESAWRLGGTLTPALSQRARGKLFTGTCRRVAGSASPRLRGKIRGYIRRITSRTASPAARSRRSSRTAACGRTRRTLPAARRECARRRYWPCASGIN